ncbi:hypothetical protein, partial [Lysinibacillus sp. D3C2_S12]|uniref:hypothetical protein n=1 Tax=Lysinibacillus sp. D3C2_S12 TaxID=2941226 RepID=UPI0020BF55B7
MSTGYRIFVTAEPYANVASTWYPVITKPYYVSAVADKEGNFVVDCRDSFIKVGNAVEIWAQDRTGNTSESIFISKKFTLHIEENGSSTSNFVITVSTEAIRHPYDQKVTVVYDGIFNPIVTWEDTLIEEDREYYFYLFPYDQYK